MANTMYVVPAKGRVVPDPERGNDLPEKGREVPRNAYWLRALTAGDVEIAKKPSTKPGNQGSDK